jgi:hypothetical protein
MMQQQQEEELEAGAAADPNPLVPDTAAVRCRHPPAMPPLSMISSRSRHGSGRTPTITMCSSDSSSSGCSPSSRSLLSPSFLTLLIFHSSCHLKIAFFSFALQIPNNVVTKMAMMQCAHVSPEMRRRRARCGTVYLFLMMV